MHTYIEVIHTALVAFPLVAVFFTLPYVLYNYHKYGSVFSLKVLIVYSFILYMMTVVFLVILPLPSRASVAASPGVPPNFIPFRFVGDIVEYQNRHHVPLWKNEALFQVLFNVLMFVPFGMYLRYYFRCSWKKAILFSFCFSLFLETTQLTGIYGLYAKAFRMFDVDDLMANTCGGLVGYALMSGFRFLLPSREKLDEESYALGRRVSLFRRILSVLCDLAFSSGFAGLMSVLLPHTFMVWIVLYFIGSVAWSKKRRTPGMAMTSMRLYSTIPPDTQTIELWQIFIRYCSIFAVFYIFPFELLDLLAVSGLFAPIAAIGYFIFTLVIFSKIVERRPVFFSKWSGTIVESDIAALEQHERALR
ncbi:VanZ family protein [Dubosiella muris]|uniref:VanZ family protein n=2 Tax=Dubosiella TaxID=1937008 RepID=UPI0014414A42|nr:VanZ family protein [Dubosiella muris]